MSKEKAPAHTAAVDMSFQEGATIRLYAHPKIMDIAWARFADGHFADAIESAFDAVAHRVLNMAKARGLKNESSGVKLMTDAFSPANPFIQLIAPHDFSEQSKKDLQQGFMYLFAGAMAAIRNVTTHNKQYRGAKNDAIRKLLFASMLMYELDNIESPPPSLSTNYCEPNDYLMYLRPVKDQGYDIDTRNKQAVCPKCKMKNRRMPSYMAQRVYRGDEEHPYLYCHACGCKIWPNGKSPAYEEDHGRPKYCDN